MITFAFLRWVFLLNLFLGLIWICAIVLPFILHPPKAFDWATFKATLAEKKFLLALQVCNCTCLLLNALLYVLYMYHIVKKSIIILK